ncbi:molecular chaperone DnaJ [Nostocales cyanobacterium HT-58-2]|nr:molecular chaperone DnaJ [Nostocales cyanobacterium HT-58-2]
MRIPLDYYRILGIPMAASEEQLRQAYGDRIVQLPRREYSQAAITSRKNLIEEAYAVLSNPKERITYDQLYLAHAYGSDSTQGGVVAVESREQSKFDNTEYQSLNIEISQDELVGALLILQELGEYELVLKLGRPYLINRNGTPLSIQGNGEDTEESPSTAAERPDVVLTVSLACLELGREQWQQSHYENAAISLETGEELLAREGLFPTVRAEIQSDLYRLRPYRILELLALPEEQTSERQQGLQLLQDILDERSGIDGTGDDKSGLNIDDFLRFIQQLRNYLTVVEQHKLFEMESRRPSAVATYLAVYASIARGFTQRQPALIRQAKQMLIRLGRRQDVHLEQSLCALLLGQTEEASRALELSQEYEALAFIRENSQDSPDLLPGLCLYGERWLENELFPNFRDLVKQPASLKDYFADKQVQAYLEALPTEAEPINQGTGIHRQSSQTQETTRRSRRNNSAVGQEQYQNKQTPNPGTQATPTPQKPESSNYSSPSYTTPPPSSGSSWSLNAQTPVAPPANIDPTATGTYRNLNGRFKASAVPPQPQTQRRHKRSSSTSSQRGLDKRHGQVHRRRVFARTSPAQIRFVFIVLASLVSLVVLWILTAATIGLFKPLFFPGPSLKGEQLSVQLNEPPVPIPDQNSKPQLPAGSLTEETAGEMVQAWLDTKAAALGYNHEIDSLDHILVGSTLTKWRGLAKQERTDNRYRKYQHSVKVESLETNQANQNHAAVEASVTEVTEYYENGQVKKSDNEKLRVRYELVRVEGTWRIQDMSVLNKLSMIS